MKGNSLPHAEEKTITSGGEVFDCKTQKTTRRNWRAADFHASQLRILYELFYYSIVGGFLAGKLQQK